MERYERLQKLKEEEAKKHAKCIVKII